jgi:hypothetical protein
MLKNPKGFGLIGVLVGLFVVAAICLTGYAVYSRTDRSDDGNKNTKPTSPEDLYTGKIHVWLSGATDDNFINYYKLDYNLPELLIGCNEDITGRVDELTSYDKKQLVIQIVAKVEPAPKTTGVGCQALSSPHKGSIDLDKEWLVQGGALELIVNNRTYTLTVDEKNYTYSLDSSNVMPFYPDKVGVLDAGPCADYTRDKLLDFAKDNGLKLADEQHPGLEKLYREPEEVHVIFDDAARTLYRRPYDRCAPYIQKPVLIQSL